MPPAGLPVAARRLLCAASGLALPLAFAPFALWPLAVVSPAILLWCWQGVAPREAARLGFFWGAGAFLAGLYWLYISLHVFGHAPLWIAIPLMLGLVAIMALYPAVTGYLWARLAPDAPALACIVLFPALWALLEWVRGWLASGFPWLALGYSQADTVLAGYAPVGGVFLSSAMVALSAGAIVALVSGAGRLLCLAVVLSAWCGGALLAPLAYTTPRPETVTVSLVQGSVSQDRKWLPEEFLPTVELYQRLTRENWDSDLIIWPEAAIPALLDSVETFVDALWEAGRRHDAALLIGIPRRDAAGDYFNSVLALDETRSLYDKRHLVPFGEYFPVPAFVRNWMRLMNLPYSDFTAGATAQPAVTAAGETLAVTICYEDVFGSELLADAARASLLVNVSNDAWFGDSIAPHQHLQIARLRAMETRRPMLRATNTGISAFIGHDGRVLGRSRQFSTEVLSREIRGRTGLTPYMRAGDWLVVVLALVAIAVVTAYRRARQTA